VTVDARLQALADARGVATSYEDYLERRTQVPEATVRRVLDALGGDSGDEQDEARLVPPTLVVRRRDLGAYQPPGPGAVASAGLELEDGTASELPVQQGVIMLPTDCPLGYHRLWVQGTADEGRVDERRADVAVLAVVPDRVALPEQLANGRAWGWMVQLYAVRSAGSWGMGDFADLAELARWSAGQGADVLLVNPLHAAAPTYPVEASPYFPASRRFASPLYLRPEQLPEHVAAPAEVRAAVADLQQQVPAADRIDRDAVWRAKSAALEALFPYAAAREGAEDSGDAGDAGDAGDSVGLLDFATYCALAEVHGRDFSTWPAELHDPRGTAVAAERERLDQRVRFHAWLQHCCDEQLAAAQAAAREAGMRVGIVHDLAVGVDPGAADAWALQDDLAHGFTVGAPPDGFNQQGQDWRLPPWRPDRLAVTGYEPVRDMLRAVLARGGGVRIDHILGLYRLWWVPEGESSGAGTYVRYDVDALLGIVALEAARAGALVVGEDLGTVPSEMSAALEAWGVLGSAVLWFERDDDADGADGADDGPAFLPPGRWPRDVMASVTTHDLPTAAGFLAGEHVRVRAELGVLGRPVSEERAQAQQDQEALRRMIVEQGLAEADASDAEVVLGMHRVAALSPARVVLAALGDAVGDLRQPNLPGTTGEYPNWRLPVADGTGRVMSLEDLQASDAVRILASALNADVANPLGER